MLISTPKSVFASKTVWGAIFTAVAAIAPVLGAAYDNHYISGKDIAQLIVVLAGSAATIVGRIQAEAPLYTPQGLPGPNEEDLKPKPQA